MHVCQEFFFFFAYYVTGFAYSGFMFCAMILSQPAITCSKLIIETLEQGVKYVQS